jgi:hypothetical protein
MEIPCTTDKGRIFMTCTMDKSYTWENVLPQHVVAFIYSGELIITYGNDTRTFVPGDTVLVAKNQLSRIEKRPVRGLPFKSVSMALSEELLRKFYLDRPVSENWSEDILKQRPIKAHSLLEGFFGSLLPYFDVQDELPEKLVDIKTHELLTIIDAIDKRASAVLGTFAEIGKVDLKKYMEEHFMYNLSLERFAFLTGRSLTTFKSDFKKAFGYSPSSISSNLH